MEDKDKKVEQLEKLLYNLNDEFRDIANINYSFNDFLFQLNRNPKKILRDVFQLFSDAINFYIKTTITSKNEKEYNTDELLIKDCESPFYADRFFTKRFMQIINNIRQSGQINRIYLFEGPPGSGKSTFLNNLLNKIQNYTTLPEGIFLKTVWHLNISKLSKRKNDFYEKIEAFAIKYQIKELLDYIEENTTKIIQSEFIDISCPYNDHPILQIPKQFRKSILDVIIEDEDFKKQLYTNSEYSWIFKEDPCHICMSLYENLYEILQNPYEIFKMLNARVFTYNRRFGYGISIYNPGDENFNKIIENQFLQNILQNLFNNDKVQYIHSPFAYTNNGIYALMDLKEKNIQRFKDLHSVISDGINKVNSREERIRTLFIGLINPEDKKVYEDIKSFQDRIVTIKIPYVLDYNIVIKIHKHRFSYIPNLFMPEVLESFAIFVVCTRIDRNNEKIKNLIKNKNLYPFLDKDLLLLKIELLSNNIPNWLTESDKNAIEDFIKKNTIESENDGFQGLSERSAISLLQTFISKFPNKKQIIKMSDLIDFLENYLKENKNLLPENFIKSLSDYYDFKIVEQVKDSVYFYNKNQITKEILNYLYAINFEIGQEINCPYTNEKIVVSEDLLKNFEVIILGTTTPTAQRIEFRKNKQKEYVSTTLAQEIQIQGKKITETKQFKDLFIDYTTNLKQNALAPYENNELFKSALKDFGKKEFEKYDVKIKNDIKRIIKNLTKKYNYTIKSAIEIIEYVLNKKLH